MNQIIFKVPLIVGNNQDEGLLGAYNVFSNETLFNLIADRWTTELGPTYMFFR